MAGKSIFQALSAIDVSGYVKAKNGLNYTPWAAAWLCLCKEYPDSYWEYKPQIMPNGDERFWHDDGVSGWVETTVHIAGEQRSMPLPIMNMKNQAIPANEITSTSANKALMRCLVKNLALFGLGINVYMGEENLDVNMENASIISEIDAIIKLKCVTPEGTERVVELCKKAQKEAFPEIDDADISGNYKMIDDTKILKNLKMQLKAIRVAKAK